MSTRDLIDAIETGDSVAIQTAFEQSVSSRIADRMDTMRQVVAQNMFKSPVAESAEETEQVNEDTDLEEAADPSKVGDSHIHVQSVGGGKYKVHAVGKKFADGIKAGEHLTDTDLDDFQEMGGKIKHIK